MRLIGEAALWCDASGIDARRPGGARRGRSAL